MRKILNQQPLDFRVFLNAGKSIPAPLAGDRVFYFGYARTALMFGLKALGIQSGDTVLLPSYICNVMLAPFNYLGVNIRYFNVNRDLLPDMNDIVQKIDSSVKAVLAVNYFGFPTRTDKIQQICEKNNIFFIEDNAHGFLSGYKGSPLGSFGDISIFSIRKTLPVPNGAALKINDPLIPARTIPLANTCTGDAMFLLRQLSLNIEDIFGINPIKTLKSMLGNHDAFQTKDEGIEEEANLEKYMVGQSKTSRIIERKFNYEQIKETRRKAFSYWLNNGVPDAEPVFTRLPEGIVPYAFPVYVKDAKDFIRDMYQKGVCCSHWPTLPSNLKEYPDFYKQLVLMPVWRQYGS